MGKIDELIKKLCPNGVKIVSLMNLIEIHTGSQFNKSDMLNEGPYAVQNGGINPSGYSYSYNTPENTITISQGGASAGYVNWMEAKFWAGAHCFVVSPTSESLSNKFLYYFLKNKETYLMQAKHGAGIPGLNRSKVQEIAIPLPPLPIQEAIVEILDNFSRLSAELQAELRARKQQYAYYRNKLLTYDEESESVEWKTLGEIMSIKAGGDVPSGTIKGQCYPTEECPYPVFSNGKGEAALYGYSPNCRNKKKAITVSARGSIGYHTVRNENFTPIVRLITMEPLTNDNIYYINYALYNVEILGSQGGIPQLTVPMIKNIAIPLPSLSEQARIVSILDKFEALVNDLSQGLPAEIEAVQKQYEYYRNKLLTF